MSISVEEKTIEIDGSHIRLDCEVDAREAAQILGIKIGTLYAWRHSGRHVDEIGPRQYRKNAKYRYLVRDLIEFRKKIHFS